MPALAAATQALIAGEARQTASVEVLKTISASPDDPRPVFALIAQRARALCDAVAVAVSEYDGTLMHMRVLEGYDPRAADSLRASFPRPPGPETISGRVVLSGRIGHVRDVAGDPELFRQARDLGEGSLLGVPLLREGRVMGVISVARHETGGFDDAQVALLQSFAEQAAIAIASARTLARTARADRRAGRRNSEYGERIEQQSATIDVLKVMSASPGDARPVFELIVARARAFCEADHVTVALLDGDLLRLQAHTGRERRTDARDYEAQFPRPLDASTMFGRAILARDAVQTPDVTTDVEHFSGTGGAPADRALDHRRAADARGHADRRHRDWAEHTGRILRDTDRTAAHLRRAGGDRDRRRGDLSRIAGAHRGAGRAQQRIR